MNCSSRIAPPDLKAGQIVALEALTAKVALDSGAQEGLEVQTALVDLVAQDSGDLKMVLGSVVLADPMADARP